MPLSAAEKQRRYRERRDADPTRRALYLAKERNAYHKKVCDGKIKLVADMTDREHRQAKKEWKTRKRSQRRNLRDSERLLEMNTPPSTPISIPGPDNPVPGPSRQKVQGKKQKQRRATQSHRKLAKLQKMLEQQRRLTERYKKRWQRSSQQKKKGTDLTPRSKTKMLLRHFNKTKGSAMKVKKTLTYHHALVRDIRQLQASTRKEGEKQLLARVLSGKVVRKYRLQRFAKDTFGLSSTRRPRDTNVLEHGKRTRKPKYGIAGQNLATAIRNFFVRDDVSRSTTGKKETITRNKIKKQKRLLNESMKILHRKFMSESPLKVSYSLFCSLRPFWVLVPSLNDRQTCVCKMHDNLAFLANKLRQLKIIETENLEEMADRISCDPKSKDCMYGQCVTCKEKEVPLLREFDKNETVTWWQWDTKSNEKEVIKGGRTETAKFQITTKDEKSGSLFDLVDIFQNRMQKFRGHIFNIRHQYQIYRQLKDDMSADEAMLHIDFAENYICKYGQEIQAIHFGGSHQQATLHTGMLYIGANDKPQPFCTVSDSTQHGPEAIWAYLDPVLKYIRENHPDVKTLHFFSDGPTSQYRQKKNFYLLSKNIHERGFSGATWNYFEASHGKGAPDGIGGALKRDADRVVASGKDIPNPASMYRSLIPVTTVKLFFVEEDNVNEALRSSGIPNDIKTIPNCMKIHQLVCVKPFTLHYRDVSCACSPQSRYICRCYNLKEHHFKQNREPEQSSAVQESTAMQESTDPVESTSTASASPVGDSTAQFDSTTSLGQAAQSTSSMSDADPHTPRNQSTDSLLKPVEEWTSDFVGQFCVVEYDGEGFPGCITAINEADVKVRCMHKIGRNRFFWPTRLDEIWYEFENVVTIIPEPRKVTERGRHFQCDPAIWAAVEETLGL